MTKARSDHPRPGRTRRREFLYGTAGLAALGFAAGAGPADQTNRRRVLRLAHVTDVHLQPELRGADGLAACLRHVQSDEVRAEMILLGGDHIMNSFAQPAPRVAAQWDLWHRVVDAENSLPIRSCLGNQDIFGWNKKESGATGEEPKYGKQWALDELGLERSYYAFSNAGWRFLVLDGLQPGPTDGSLAAYYDEAQAAWLLGELEQTPKDTPILVLTHVPVISGIPLLMAKRETPHGHALVASGNVHTDVVDVLAMLSKFPNVKVCLSGHLHRVEHLAYQGIDFYCTGAVCGSWWKGPHEGFPEGYAVVDLYDDGSHEYRYVSYGWKAS